MDVRPILGDLTGKGDLFCIAVSDFERRILPTLTSHDSVIWIGSLGSQTSYMHTVMDRYVHVGPVIDMVSFRFLAKNHGLYVRSKAF